MSNWLHQRELAWWWESQCEANCHPRYSYNYHSKKKTTAPKHLSVSPAIRRDRPNSEQRHVVSCIAQRGRAEELWEGLRRTITQAAHVGITRVSWSSWGHSAWTLMGDTHLACLAKHRLRSILNKPPKQRFIGLKEYCNRTKFIKKVWSAAQAALTRATGVKRKGENDKFKSLPCYIYTWVNLIH